MPTVLVCGLGRCGSTLVMKMLHAGGFPVFAESIASYEHDRLRFPDSIAEAVRDIGDNAAKILNPQLWEWGHSLHGGLKVIWLDRNYHQQAKSTVKFLRLVGGVNVPNAAVAGIEKSFPADVADAGVKIDNSGADILRLSFESIIEKPRVAASRINSFIGGLDEKKMVAVVINRPTACADGVDIELAAAQAEDSGKP